MRTLYSTKKFHTGEITGKEIKDQRDRYFRGHKMITEIEINI